MIRYYIDCNLLFVKEIDIIKNMLKKINEKWNGNNAQSLVGRELFGKYLYIIIRER